MGTRRLKATLEFDITGEGDARKFAGDLREIGKAGNQAAPNINKAASSTSLLSGAVGKLAAGGFLLAAGKQLLEFGKASITAASDVQEMQSKFDTVFRDLGGDVTAELEKFTDAANRSIFDLQGFAATLQDTFVPLGFARDEAASMSIEIVKLAEDLASFNNLNTADVVTDLQSALVGNTETLRKYGVVANQAAIDQEALALGLSFTKGQMDAQTKAAAILSLTMKGTTDAQGDAIKTADSYANQVKGMQAAVSELQVAIGTALLPVMTELVGLVTLAADNLTVAAGAAGAYGDEVGGIISDNIAAAKSFSDFVDEAQKIDDVRGIWGGLGPVVTGTTNEIAAGMSALAPKLAQSAGSLEEFMGVFNSLSRASQDDLKAVAFAQNLTIEGYYELQQSLKAANEATAGHDAAMLNAVATYQHVEEATIRAAEAQDPYIQAMIEGYAALDEYEEKQENTAVAVASTEAQMRLLQEQMIRGISPASELGDKMGELSGIAAHTAAAFDATTGSVDRSALALEKLLGYMDTLDGRVADVSVNVSVSGLDQAERAEAISDRLGSGGGTKGASAGGSKASGAGQTGDTGFDPEGPKFASGTNGWTTVPGPLGAPVPITVHGGELMNVIPAGQGGTTNNDNSNINVVQNFHGSPPNVMQQARDGIMEALNSQGVKGFA